MSTNSRFAIAIHVLTLLASSDEPLASPLLAGSVGVNPVTVRKVVMTLRDCGLVHTVIGSSGGATLARQADTVTLRDVYLCVRESTMFGNFPENPSPACLVGRNIQHILEDLIDETEKQMLVPLAEITIANLLEQVKTREVAM